MENERRKGMISELEKLVRERERESLCECVF